VRVRDSGSQVEAETLRDEVDKKSAPSKSRATWAAGDSAR
jgi:hypothetical protein